MGHESWKTIRESLSESIEAGEWAPGTQLPTETELCRRYAAGRHSVRRAVRALAVEGKLRVVQGSGTFVESAPLINYTIGRRTRFRQNLLGQGLTPTGEHMSTDRVAASPTVAAALGLPPGAEVYRVTRRGLADDVPINLVMSFHSAATFPELGDEQQDDRSITDIYRDHGIADYFRKRTTMFTRRPDRDEAALLNQHPDQPVMVLTKIDVTAEGLAIGYSEAVWAGDRVKFTIDSLDEDLPMASENVPGESL